MLVSTRPTHSDAEEYMTNHSPNVWVQHVGCNVERQSKIYKQAKTLHYYMWNTLTLILLASDNSPNLGPTYHIFENVLNHSN